MYRCRLGKAIWKRKIKKLNDEYSTLITDIVVELNYHLIIKMFLPTNNNTTHIRNLL